ncbi:hypothetical protein DICSQDRAFT_163594 [Dichomitus squalens LYAD-421 SS1]|uniref:Uncharacterized protein n=1 Tax=Dichomitus squalens (strain LYAD-421) TaxID=732165 RepID=R7SMB8_DICSQ|nr:uncharacterized protein DICSQDRAFT_163594 [Dichomitus squalens LYAD-421 SS1]EJF57033.1 hypothetical protein DICSQDRAFT_163594 [Dichomitus squalens LYAD-421 SS1]
MRCRSEPGCYDLPFLRVKLKGASLRGVPRFSRALFDPPLLDSATMSPTSSISLLSREVGANEAALSIITYFTSSESQSSVQLFIASVAFGVLTALVGVALAFLIRQGLLARRSVLLLFLSTLLLYSSTSVYMSVLVWNRLSVSQIMSQATTGITSSTYDADSSTASLERVVGIQSWMMTIAAGTNIIIGDAVVWWRACVVWSNRIVYFMGPPLLALTLVCGVINVHNSETGPSLQLQMLIGVDGFADAFMILSMVTNLLATSLIAYKAWEHRRSVKAYFGSDGGATATWRALALLVESGTIYCAMLMFLAVYQLRRPAEVTSSASAFAQTGWFFTDACLLPIAAIYPTFIIVLVAMKRSPIDRGVSQVNGEREAERAAGPLGTLVFNHSVVGSAGTQYTVNSTVDRLGCHSESEDVYRSMGSTNIEKRGQIGEV